MQWTWKVYALHVQAWSAFIAAASGNKIRYFMTFFSFFILIWWSVWSSCLYKYVGSRQHNIFLETCFFVHIYLYRTDVFFSETSLSACCLSKFQLIVNCEHYCIFFKFCFDLCAILCFNRSEFYIFNSFALNKFIRLWSY